MKNISNERHVPCLGPMILQGPKRQLLACPDIQGTTGRTVSEQGSPVKGHGKELSLWCSLLLRAMLWAHFMCCCRAPLSGTAPVCSSLLFHASASTRFLPTPCWEWQRSAAACGEPGARQGSAASPLLPTPYVGVLPPLGIVAMWLHNLLLLQHSCPATSFTS